MNGEAPVTVASKGPLWVTRGTGYPPKKCGIHDPEYRSMVSGK